MTEADVAAVAACVADAGRVVTNAQTVQRLSRDFYWYSPVLKKKLDEKRAELVVQPVSVEEIQAVLACCFARGVPVTVRARETMGRRFRWRVGWCWI